MNDTIVVFDRLRENWRSETVQTSGDLANLVNLSIWQTIRRSIYTVLTVIIGSLSLFYWGAEPLHAFALAIFFGLVYGAYSSIFIAAPLWFVLKQKSLPAIADDTQVQQV